MSVKSDSVPALMPPADSGIVELSLMLSIRQFEALEERASSEHMSVAQFLRRLVHDSTLQEPVLN